MTKIAVGTVLIWKLVSMLRLPCNADDSLQKAIESLTGRNIYSTLVLFEAKAWYYVLLMRDGKTLRYSGERHIGYTNNGGNASD